jgi:ribonuclease HI
MAHTSYRLFFDGSCGPKNPGGTAAYGFALFADGEEPIKTGTGIIGTGPGMTNNLAEFSALYEGLACFCATTMRYPATINVLGDSKLVIQVMNKHWKPKPEAAYWSAYKLCDGIVREMRSTGIILSFDWIPRELNTQCDKLSKAY